MTVIAAVVTDGRAWMAADSRTSWGSCYRDDADKLYRLGAAVVGLAGHSLYNRAMGTAPPLHAGASADETAEWCGRLVDHLIDYGRGRGHGEQVQGASVQTLTLLVATPAGLWEVGGDGSVLRVACGYTAIGSGGAEARGVLVALRHGDEPAERLFAALEASIALDSSCGGAIRLETLP